MFLLVLQQKLRNYLPSKQILNEMDLKNKQPVLKLPGNKKVKETEIGYFWYEDEILYGVARSRRRTLDNISDALQTIRSLVKGSKAYFVVDLTLGRPYSLEEKKFIKEGLFPMLKGIAILAATPMGRMLGRTVYAKEFPGIPVSEFECAEDAEDWIKQLKHKD